MTLNVIPCFVPTKLGLQRLKISGTILWPEVTVRCQFKRLQIYSSVGGAKSFLRVLGNAI